jgi:hypothetical protein
MQKHSEVWRYFVHLQHGGTLSVAAVTVLEL